MSADIPSLLVHFADIPDPRDPRGIRHSLQAITSISILAVIAGADDFDDINEFGQTHHDWLTEFLPLPHGVPSSDTFLRVFTMLNPNAWQGRFLAWTREFVLPEDRPEDDVISIDGKTARGSGRAGLGALHTVSVYSSALSAVLLCEEVDTKTNEITVVPDLLAVLAPAGSVVTGDALLCQKQIAREAREHHAHYLLALKDNHPTLFADTKWLFAHADEIGWGHVRHDYHQTLDRGHGREEKRECWVVTDLSLFGEVVREATVTNEPAGVAGWRDLSAVVRIRCERTSSSGTSVTDRYYLTSLPGDAARVLRCARTHWGIENQVHWVVDVAFGEDASRARSTAQANLVALRRLALNLIKADPSKGSVKRKRKRAGWDRKYLLHLLTLR